jgi:pimeloyl-[acyl-carrier protein] methyl ester esterase
MISILAMHGWAGDSRGWEPFATAAAARGWAWDSCDRGYGVGPARTGKWDPAAQRRVLIGHSLGPHLVPTELLASTDAIALLASFGRFVPPGRPGRRLQEALTGMATALEGDGAESMLRRFLAEASAPEPYSELPYSIVDGPLPPAGRERLRHDLKLLESRCSLPPELPARIPCLIVEAGADRIVAPEARQLLRQERPDATVLVYPEAGHCLLNTPIVSDVITWIADL